LEKNEKKGVHRGRKDFKWRGENLTGGKDFCVTHDYKENYHNKGGKLWGTTLAKRGRTKV